MGCRTRRVPLTTARAGPRLAVLLVADSPRRSRNRPRETMTPGLGRGWPTRVIAGIFSRHSPLSLRP